LAALADDVNVTSNVTTGIDLNSYVSTTIKIFPAVIVSNSNAADTISASAHAWSLTNQGQVRNTTGNDAIQFSLGGTVNNEAGAKVFSQGASAINIFGATGTVVNKGTIENAGIGDTVGLYAGGSVTNEAGATIAATGALQGAVSISGGTSRTVTNSGTISNTSSGNFAAGVLIQGGAGTVTNNATGTIFGSYNGVYSSGTVNLTLTNNGSISSTRGPAVEVGGGGGTVINTGTIESAATTNNSNGAALRFSGAGSVTNTGTIRSTGSGIAITFVGAATHTLTLGTGSMLGGTVAGGTGTDNLILGGSGTESIAKFSSFETLTMNGADWTLTGSGTFSTSATVQSGTLRVNGQLTSAVGILSGGTLTGSGTVVGNVTNNAGGNVQVDAATLLTFNGNYVHQTGAYFTVGVTPSTNGTLAITGAGHTTTINGGTVRVFAGMGAYNPTTVYTILTATGGRTGFFDGATSNFAFLAPTLTYDPNNVYLALERNSIDFASVGITPNQISAGRGLEALGMGNPMVNAALLLTPEQARAAFDSVSGEIHPSLHTLMLDESNLVRDAILGRQRQDLGAAANGPRATAWANEDDAGATASSYARKARKAKAPQWPIKAAPPAAAPVYSAWVQGYGNWTRLNGDGNAATLQAASGGAIGGVDVTLNHNWRFGFATGGGHSDARVDARRSSGTIDTFHLAAYGAGRIGDILFRTGAAYSHHEVATARTIAFPGFADYASAKYGASTAQVFGEAAYRMVRNGLSTEAFAGLARVHVRSDGFTESGGPAALSGAQADTAITLTTLGLRAQAPVPFFNAWAVTARGSLGWQHAFDAVTPTALMSFAASSTPFAIAGVPLASDTFLLEAGLDAMVARNARISLLYAGRLAADASAHAVKANLAVAF
jgi:outer membrane autotransporter protein